LAGMEGNINLQEPKNWEKVYESIKPDPKLVSLADDIAQKFGNAELTQRLLTVISDPGATPEDEKKAIRVLTAQQNMEFEGIIPELLQNPDLRIETIKAIAAYDSPQ